MLLNNTQLALALDRDGITPLHYGVREGNVATIISLLGAAHSAF
jgi:ankyrin repeat protein